LSLKSNLPQNETREFIQENDTFRLAYSFSGQNCPLDIWIYNKQNIPLYIDWQKSSAIVNGNRISLWDNSSEQITLIPPQSYVHVSPLYMITEFVPLLPEDKAGKVSFANGSGYNRAIRYAYQQDNSPLSFRCFLVYSTQKDFSSENYSDNNFWLSDIIPTNTQIPVYKTGYAYLKKSSAFSTVAGAAVLIGLVAILAEIPAEEE
jgi:hypothetical protein